MRRSMPPTASRATQIENRSRAASAIASASDATANASSPSPCSSTNIASPTGALASAQDRPRVPPRPCRAPPRTSRARRRCRRAGRDPMRRPAACGPRSPGHRPRGRPSARPRAGPAPIRVATVRQLDVAEEPACLRADGRVVPPPRESARSSAGTARLELAEPIARLAEARHDHGLRGDPHPRDRGTGPRVERPLEVASPRPLGCRGPFRAQDARRLAKAPRPSRSAVSEPMERVEVEGRERGALQVRTPIRTR